MFRGKYLALALLAALAGWTQGAVAAEQQTTLADLGKSLKIDAGKVSVSGISSGGFMAHQFHVAHSGNLMGVGIIAGGPYHCAQGDVMRGMLTCTAFMAETGCKEFMAIGNPLLGAMCSTLYYNGPGPAPAGKPASDAAIAMAQQSVDDTFQEGLDIDSPQGIIGDRVILIHGQLDNLLPVGVMDAVDQYYGKVYEKLAVQPTAGGLRYLKQLPADHSVPTDNIIGLKVGSQVGDCKAFASPYLNACRKGDCAQSCCQQSAAATCGDPANATNAKCRTCDVACTQACFAEIDSAGTILAHIYGPLKPRSTGPGLKVRDWGFMSPPTVLSDCKKGRKVDSRCAWLQKRIFAFNQNEVFDGSATDTYKALMAEKGFAFVPKQCQQGQPCALHVAFHGCRQGHGFYGFGIVPSLYGGDSGWTHFVENAGYNEWADANDIVVLYPQARSREFQGSIQHANPQGCWDLWGYTDANYHTRDGQQIKAVWKMVQALVPKLGQQASPEQ